MFFAKRRPYILVMPALIFISVLFLAPIVFLLFNSIYVHQDGRYFSFASYITFLSDSYGWALLLRTVRISFFTVLACLILAFPVALHMRRLSSHKRSMLAIALLSPLLTSVVVRTLAWVTLLGPKGLVNSAVVWLGFTPLPLMYNDFGVIVGLTHVFFGYMFLALTASTLKLDDTPLLAAANLGASHWQIFRHIVLPLCMPGIVSGSILVFAMSASAYIVPELLGGSATKVMATEIYDLAINYLEWNDATVVAVVLFVALSLIVAVMTKFYEPLRRAVSGAEES